MWNLEIRGSSPRTSKAYDKKQNHNFKLPSSLSLPPKKTPYPKASSTRHVQILSFGSFSLQLSLLDFSHATIMSLHTACSFKLTPEVSWEKSHRHSYKQEVQVQQHNGDHDLNPHLDQMILTQEMAFWRCFISHPYIPPSRNTYLMQVSTAQAPVPSSTTDQRKRLPQRKPPVFR